MAKIVSFGNIDPKDFKENPIKTAWEAFKSLDKSIKLLIITGLLFIASTPFIVNNILTTRNLAQETQLPSSVKITPEVLSPIKVGEKINLSALAYDRSGSPINLGIKYDWLVVSNSTTDKIGTINYLNTILEGPSAVEFVAQHPGYGQITVVAYGSNSNAYAKGAVDVTVTDENGNLICAQDVKKCPDGSYVSRDPKNNCEFNACPTDTVQKATITAFQDAFVRSDQPNNNLGYGQRLKADGDPKVISYLKFEIPSIINNSPVYGKKILSAKLRLKVSDDTGSGSSDSFNLRRIEPSSWSEGKVTWNNRPSLGSILTTFKGQGLGEVIEIDIKNLITFGIESIRYSFAIATEGTNELILNSREAKFSQPQIIIEYQ